MTVKNAIHKIKTNGKFIYTKRVIHGRKRFYLIIEHFKISNKYNKNKDLKICST